MDGKVLDIRVDEKMIYISHEYIIITIYTTMLRVTGLRQWRNLDLIVLNKGVIFDKMPYYSPCKNTHKMFCIPIFTNAETIMVRNSNKFWLFYNLNQKVFPKATRIILDTHPCHDSVMERFPMMYLTVRFNRFADLDTQLISPQEFDEMERFWTLELMKK